MTKTIKVSNPQNLLTIDFHKLKILQGDLKTLSKENLTKLCNSIKRYGYFTPAFLWHSGNDFWILDATQRYHALEELEKEKYEIPEIPYIETELKGWHGQGGNYSKVIGDNENFDYSGFNWLDIKEQFWWGANYYAKTLPSGGSWFVWDKRTNESEARVDNRYGSEFEICWSKQKHRQEIVRKMWSGLYGTETQDIRNRIHPTQKPIELAAWFINKFSKENDIIADFFLGSGTTLISCAMLNRTLYGCEIDPHYVDIAIIRWINWMLKEGKENEIKILRNGKEFDYKLFL